MDNFGRKFPSKSPAIFDPKNCRQRHLNWAALCPPAGHLPRQGSPGKQQADPFILANLGGTKPINIDV